MVGMQGRMSGLVAQHQISDYHMITIPVKKYLEVIRISWGKSGWIVPTPLAGKHLAPSGGQGRPWLSLGWA